MPNDLPNFGSSVVFRRKGTDPLPDEFWNSDDRRLIQTTLLSLMKRTGVKELTIIAEVIG
jgi:hypothetical protein